MTSYVNLILYVSAILIGVLFRKSKICTIYICVIMYVFASFRTRGADLENYRTGYVNLKTSTGSRYPGYDMFLRIFFNRGLTFNDFLKIFYLIFLALLLIEIRFLTKNINFVLSCYMLYAYPLDVVQMKSALAELLAFAAIVIIINAFSCGNEADILYPVKLVFVLVLLGLSVLMHFSTIYYFFALLIYMIVRKHKDIGKKIFAILVIVSAFIYGGGIIFAMQVANGLGLVSDMNYLNMWTKNSMGFGFVVYTVLVCLIIFACRYNVGEIITTDREKTISDFVLTAAFTLPLLYMNGNYSRILRIYMLLMYILFSNKQIKKYISGKKLLNYISYVGAIGLFFYLDVIYNYKLTLGALLTSNSVLN